MSARSELTEALRRYASVEHELALAKLYHDLPTAIDRFANERAAMDLAKRIERDERRREEAV